MIPNLARAIFPEQSCNDCQKRFPIEQLTVLTAQDRGRDVFVGFQCPDCGSATL